MGEVIEIGNRQLAVKETSGQRVVTFRDVDNLHGRTEGTARQNYYRNREAFIEGRDCYVIKSHEASELGIRAPRGLTLLTESGYLMLVKSLNDPLAWDVQRKLVDVYFRAKQAAQQQPDFMAMVPKTYSDALRKLADTWEENQQLKAENQAMLPKAEFYDKVSDADGLLTVNEAAKLIGWGEQTLFAYLRKNEILCSNPHNIPRQLHINLGRFEVKERVYNYDGNVVVYSRTYVTPKGLQWLQKTLAASGKGVAVNA